MIFSERQNFSIAMMARLLEVSRSGYYTWVLRQSQPSKRTQSRDQRDHLIKVAFKENHERFGSPRLTSYLNQNGMNTFIHMTNINYNLVNLDRFNVFLAI